MEAQGTTATTPEPELGTLAPNRATTLASVWDWTVHEAAWSLDVFTRMFATIVVLRAVSQLVSHWWFPKGVFDASPTLLRGFGGAQPAPKRPDTVTVDDAEVEEDDIPELVMASDGDRFYRHRTRHAQQYWACPLLRRHPCRDCEHFIEDATGQPRCAAVMKLLLRYHEHYRHFTLEELRTLLERGRPDPFAQ